MSEVTAEQHAELATLKNWQIMEGIYREMREIPMLESEKPKDVSALTKVEFPEAGGMLTHMWGHDHPYRGFPHYQFVDRIDLVKKIVRQTQSGMYHALKRFGKLSYILVPLIPVFGKEIFYGFTYTFFRLIERTRIKSHLYSDAVREIYRAFSVPVEGEDERGRELREMLRDIECSILEFDNAYRYRAQDILGVFDKDTLRKKPAKEMCRVLDVMVEREKTEEIKDTWRLLQMVVRYYMRYDDRLMKIIQNVLLEADTHKTQLSVEDKWYCVPREDYTFAFMQNPTPEDQTLIERSQAALREREAAAQQQ